jgi:hypothetical protein
MAFGTANRRAHRHGPPVRLQAGRGYAGRPPVGGWLSVREFQPCRYAWRRDAFNRFAQPVPTKDFFNVPDWLDVVLLSKVKAWSSSKTSVRLLYRSKFAGGMVVLVKVKPTRSQGHGLRPWIEAAKKRLHHNVLAIALANKLARIACSVLAHGRAFEANKL